jgi:hypothetical protein
MASIKTRIAGLEQASRATVPTPTDRCRARGAYDPYPQPSRVFARVCAIAEVSEKGFGP